MWNQDSNDYKPNAAGRTEGAPGAERRPVEEKARMATLGASVCIKGEITGSEDLTIDGQVEGKIDLPEHVLTIGPNAMIMADVAVKSLAIFGTVIGNIKARERVDLRNSGSVEGTIVCGRIAMQEGAKFVGKLQTSGQKSAKDAKGEKGEKGEKGDKAA
jgi:cytoskeletal protein CcmA (bactofilin family)